LLSFSGLEFPDTRVYKKKVSTTMNKNPLSKNNWLERVVLAILFVVLGTAIMYVFNPWGSGTVLPKVYDYITKIGVCIVLLAAAFLAKRSLRFQRYWQILFGLFILTLTVTLDLVFGIYYIKYLNIQDTSPVTIAFQKLNEAFVVVSVVIGCTLASGNNLGSIYIQKGKLKLGLWIGLGAFLLAAAGSFPMAASFKAQNLTIARVLPWIPWVLIFVLSNATLEELLFRGLFLRKLEPFFGKFLSNLLVAIVFTLMHGAVTYTVDQYMFLAILFPLALLWGYIMQKTDAIWASILFHAGMDISIILGIFSNL
jgi:membrane protease YdiL (CAAX protease family)